MVADLFHYGHVGMLRQAKEHGDYLLVGVHADETVMSYKRRPIFSMEERVASVEGCRYVDEVVAVAKELGINLGPDEAVKYQNYLIEQMEQLDTFTIRTQTLPGGRGLMKSDLVKQLVSERYGRFAVAVLAHGATP